MLIQQKIVRCRTCCHSVMSTVPTRSARFQAVWIPRCLLDGPPPPPPPEHVMPPPPAPTPPATATPPPPAAPPPGTCPRSSGALSGSVAVRWELIHADSYCTGAKKTFVNQHGEAIGGPGTSTEACQQIVLDDVECGNIMYGNGDSCRCVRVGEDCSVTSSSLSHDNVYEYHCCNDDSFETQPGTRVPSTLITVREDKTTPQLIPGMEDQTTPQLTRHALLLSACVRLMIRAGMVLGVSCCDYFRTAVVQWPWMPALRLFKKLAAVTPARAWAQFP